MKPTSRTRWRLAGTLAVTVAVLAVLVRKVAGGTQLVAVASRASPGWIAIALAAVVACTLVTAQRWRLVLAGMGYAVAPGRALFAVMATAPLATVTPTRSNDLLRPLVLRDEVPLDVGGASVVAEKVVDVLVLLALAATGAMLARMWLLASAVTGLLFGIGWALGLLLSRHRSALLRMPVLRRWPERAHRIADALTALRGSPGRLAAVAAASLTIRLLTVAITHALLVSVGSDVRWWQTLEVWPTAILVGLAPVTLGGAGTRDAAFLWLLAAAGAHVESAGVLAATMGYWVCAFAVPAVVGLPFMVRAASGTRSHWTVE